MFTSGNSSSTHCAEAQRPDIQLTDRARTAFDLDWALVNLPSREVRAHHIYGPQLQKRVAREYERDYNLTAAKLAKTYGTSPSWMQRAIEKSGVELRPKGARRKPRPYTDAQLRAEHEGDRRSVRAIAQKYSVGLNLVYRDMTRLRIPLHSVSEQRRLDQSIN